MENLLKDSVVSLIHRSKKILCVTREQYTGDGLCAMLAMQYVLKKLKKEVVCTLPQGVFKNYKFLAGADLIQKDLGESGDFVVSISTGDASVDRVKYLIEESSVDIVVTPKHGKFRPEDVSFKQNAGDFDLILAFDTSSLESLGVLFESHTELFSGTPIVNFSTDPVNDYFGKINLIDFSKSSTCEVLYELFTNSRNNYFDGVFDESLATILLAGIIESTGSFLENNTTASSLSVASELQSFGAEQSNIIDNLFKKKSLDTLKIWGRILGNLQLDLGHKMAWSTVSSADFSIAGVKPEEVDNIAYQLLRFTKGADLVALLIEYPDKTLIQIRSSNQGVFFVDLQRVLGGEILPEGLDVELSKKQISDVEGHFLQAMMKYQKNRLGIPNTVPLKRVELLKSVTKKAEDIIFPGMTKQSKKAVKPKSPESIPFIAPFQPHEKTGKVGDDEKGQVAQKSAEKTVIKESVKPTFEKPAENIDDSFFEGPKKSGVPDWLKKS